MSPGQVVAWWDGAQAGAVFGLAGAAVGVLGGVFGTVLGAFARQGRLRGLVLTVQWTAVVAGAGSLAVGLYALAVGQPYGVWFPLALLGGVTAGVFGGLLPVTRNVYRAAEHRRMDAAEFRSA